MPHTLETLRERAKETRLALEAEYARRFNELGGRFERGRVVFEAEVRERQRAARQAFGEYVRGIKVMNIITSPIIYSVLIAFVVMDIFVTVYMWICFPTYGIERVKRRDHVVIDRHMLPYLNWVQKMNCIYCGYGNGVLSYAREVAARTEAYWCPIKHARTAAGVHDHYADFLDYGDDCDFVDKWAEQRRKITNGKRADRPVHVKKN